MESRSLKAKANYSRICHLLVDKATNALRIAFHAVHPPSTLASVLNANKKTLQRIGYTVIKASQWDLLFPRSGSPDSKNFDITLLTVLLRNICGLSAPATGWNVMPPVSDTSISANIVRLKMFRNEVYGHFTSSAGLGDITFETLWKEISVPLVKLGIPQKDIDQLKVAPLSLEEESLIEGFKEWKQQDDDVMSKLSDFEREVHNLDVYKDSFVRYKIPNLDNHSRLVHFSRKIDKTPLEKSNYKGAEEFKYLDITQRKLIFDGPLTWRMTPTKHIYLHALLLDDLLVLLQKQDDKYVLKCQSTMHCPVLKLSTLLAKNIATDKKAFIVVGTSNIGPQIYELVAATNVERQSWLKYITEAIEFWQERQFMMQLDEEFPYSDEDFLLLGGDIWGDDFQPNVTQFTKNTANQLTEGNGTLMKKDNFSEFSGTSLKDGSKPSLVEENFSFSDEVTTVKHREKIMLLKAKDCNELRETKIPLKYFSKDEALRIADGSPGTHVYVGLMENGREVAVKRILKETTDRLAQNELEIFRLTRDIRSPYIVNYWSFDCDDFFMYLVIDLCEENLNDYVAKTCSLEYLRKHGLRMIEEILLGLQVLHDRGILHRDLKPSNILVTVDGRMQLSDFGISRVLNDDESTFLTAPKGTVGWIPPEVIKEMDNEGSKGRYKKKSDVHVAGMIAFFILTKGEHPFGPRLERMSNISKGKPIFLDKVTAQTAQQFISELISHNIDHRPYVKDALKHCFFKEQSQSIVYYI